MAENRVAPLEDPEIAAQLLSSVTGEEKAEVDELLASCGMTTVLSATLNRRIVRSDNLEVWQ